MITYLTYLILSFLLIINLSAFTVMLIDKRRSMQGTNVERIPEGILFFLASACGSAGIFVAMYLLRHKTRKWYFQIGIPLLVVQNYTTLYLLYITF